MSQLPALYAATLPAHDEDQTPGHTHTVHMILLHLDAVHMFLERLEKWYEQRDEVVLVSYGETATKQGYIVMEWEECQPDKLLLSMLGAEEFVVDYSHYSRPIQ